MSNVFNKLLSKYSTLIIFLLASSISILSAIYMYQHDLVLAMEDGRAHLDIARRVIDSLTPGLAQLGSIWLPIPHLFMLLFVWNNSLWHTGLAGVIPSAFFFIISAVFLFKFIDEFTNSKTAAFVGTLIYLTNPNLLFIQATPMTESMSISFFIMSIYFLWRWMSQDNKFFLLGITGLLICFLTLTRYDGWFLPAMGAVCIIIYGLYRKWMPGTIEGNTLLFLVPSFIGILSWIAYNALIFGDPLNFLRGEGSAKWFAKFEAARGNLPTDGNILISSQIYGYSIFDIVGAWITLLGAVGLIVFIISSLFKKISVPKILIILFALSPIIFNIYSLFSGNSVMWSQWIPPYKLYNVRYALQALPAIVILIAYLVSIKKRLFVPIVIAVVLFQFYIFYNAGQIVLLKDITQTKGSTREYLGRWLKENPTNGLTLISAGANEVVIFDSGMDIKKIVYEGNGKYWKEALKHPEKNVSRIIMGSELGAQNDKVHAALSGKQVIHDFYKIVYTKDNYVVYDKLSPDEILRNRWLIKSVDTMKTSRDEAQNGLKKVNYKVELKKIKDLGANYVAIDTPYDEEFYPYLKTWTDEAHKLGMKVWFRGNWSGWEGWNDYPKRLTRTQHIEKTVDFINSHQDLFKNGDSFTPCPECEYGGPGSPIKTGDVEGFKQFMIDEYQEMTQAFKETGKDVNVSWFSINPDVAKLIYDKELLEKTGNTITLDYFVKDKKQLDDGLNYFSKKFPGVKILIGEFGAPIPTQNGKMTEEQQAAFVEEILKYLAQRKDIIGVNYWVSTGGTTPIFNKDLTSRKAANVVKKYFSPIIRLPN